MELNPISLNKIAMKNELTYNGEILLTYRIEYPEFHSSCFQMCLNKVNRFYQNKAHAFQRHCEIELFPMAIEQYNEDRKNNYPIRAFDAVLVYEVTYLSACIISIYFDQYEYTGGAHGNTVRSSQTWNLQRCELIRLRQLFCCLPDYKAYILTAVEAQIKNEPDLYFEDYEELIAEAFNPCSFYCTPEGVVVYYQQYDIAPYASGIREFLLPYTNCVSNPQT